MPVSSSRPGTSVWSEAIGRGQCPHPVPPPAYPAALLMSGERNPEARGKFHWPFGRRFKQWLRGRASPLIGPHKGLVGVEDLKARKAALAPRNSFLRRSTCAVHALSRADPPWGPARLGAPETCSMSSSRPQPPQRLHLSRGPRDSPHPKQHQ